MPHKHKRKRDSANGDFDLPPSIRAKSLPVIDPTKEFLQPRKRSRTESVKSRHRKPIDDTPKSFARLMAWHKDGLKLQKGLDNGIRQKQHKTKRLSQILPRITDTELHKKQANSATNPAHVDLGSESHPQAQSQAPTIRPGETLAQFNVRVDQSLPLSTASMHSSVNPVKIPGVQDAPRLTKHNKRLARMQAEWRNTEANLREKMEEAAEENEEKQEEEAVLWSSLGQAGGKGSKKKRRIQEDNPWKDLEKKRAETKPKTILDVVQAPPMLKKVRNVFKTGFQKSQGNNGNSGGEFEDVGVDVKNVPSLGKSLRRREELNETRKAVIDAYRKQTAAQQRNQQGFPSTLSA